MKNQNIKILLLEDSACDAELIVRELKKSNICFQSLLVDTKESFINALEEFKPDIVLSDYVMPSFSGLAALAIVCGGYPDMPFIFISGSVGEETAVEALKSGATDYVFKDHMVRLVTCVERALKNLNGIKERKYLEEQLRQTQKMEVVGRLAGGVAHDFNNILTAISGYTEFILNDLSANDPHRQDVEEIKNTVYRAASLTRQLLAFSRKQILRPEILDLNSVVSNIERMLKRLIGEDISLCTCLAPHLGRVLADEGQIEQILMNLAVNSRDAMPKGGTLKIETLKENPPEAGAGDSRTCGNLIALRVSDTGSGMSKEILSHLFEPFFTTKEPGKGTGLGLSTTYNIVQQFKGSINVDSEQGRGTVFTIYFPPIQEALLSIGETPIPKDSLKGNESVLLVDDDEMVRALSKRILAQNGYLVAEAHSGDHALKLLQDISIPIDLIITDVILPGMSGPELAEKAKSLRPGAQIFFISGYTDDLLKNHGILNTEKLLLKPFTPNDLLRKAREVLNAGKTVDGRR